MYYTELISNFQARVANATHEPFRMAVFPVKNGSLRLKNLKLTGRYT